MFILLSLFQDFKKKAVGSIFSLAQLTNALNLFLLAIQRKLMNLFLMRIFICQANIHGQTTTQKSSILSFHDFVARVSYCSQISTWHTIALPYTPRKPRFFPRAVHRTTGDAPPLRHRCCLLSRSRWRNPCKNTASSWALHRYNS